MTSQPNNANVGIQLNHTLVACHDQTKSAEFICSILGLPDPVRSGPFLVVELANGVSLDYDQVEGPIACQHYAFLISEVAFDEIFGRIRARELAYWADPFQKQPQQINHNDGGRGVYFPDPDGHLLEVITRPYGSGSS